MSCRRLITASVIITGSLVYMYAASAFDAMYKLPCSISYDGKPIITTNCMMSMRISKEVMVATIKTPNGRTFIIENDIADVNGWYLNHKRAEKVSDEPNTCYQNTQVKICF